MYIYIYIYILFFPIFFFMSGIQYLKNTGIREEELPALKTALTHRYNNSKTKQKSAEEETILTKTRINTTKIT